MATINSFNNQVLDANVLFNGGTFGAGTDATANTISIGTAGARLITIGSTSSLAIALNCGTAGISVGTSANNHTSTFGSINGTSTTVIQSGSGGITLTGVVTSANALAITSGNLTLTAQTNVGGTTGVIKIANVPFISALDQSNNPPSSTFVGANSGNTLITLIGTNNTGIGYSALNALTSGDRNTTLGSSAGLILTSGDDNTFIGSGSGIALISGNKNTSVGSSSLMTANGTSQNTAIGYNSLSALTTGSNNIALGWNAGTNYTNERNNIVIGSNGVALDDRTIRIGTNGTHTSTLIAGTLATQNDITATSGNVQSLTGLIIAGGDPGAPISGLTAISNVEDVTVGNGAGVLTIKSKSANSDDSVGFIKIYVRNTAYYIPVFSTPSP